MALSNARIEEWALRIIDSVVNGRPTEDARVELKSDWIDGHQVARQLAGHANASRGEHILWLIGVDEKGGTVAGVAADRRADWWAAVESEFSEIAPSVHDLNIPYEGKVVVALLFETTRAPFVIKSRREAAGDLEVPWRRGTATRTARRADLLRLLVPIAEMPDVEVIGATLVAGAIFESGKGARELEPQAPCQWKLLINLYITPRNREIVVFPGHKASITVTQPESLGTRSFAVLSHTNIGMTNIGELSRIIERDQDYVVTRPQRVSIEAACLTPLEGVPGSEARAVLQLFVAGEPAGGRLTFASME